MGQFKCFECDSKAHHAHHIIPKSLGGTKTIPLCHGCHEKVHCKSFTDVRGLIKKGIQRAREEGKHVGRPKIKLDLRKIADLYASGLSQREIAKKFKVSEGTISRALQDWREDGQS